MAHESGTAIIVNEGHWKHIRHIRIYHRRYPEVRGEGRSLTDAASHLINQLTSALDFVHGRKRESLERVIADVRAIRTSRPRHPPEAVAATP